MIIWVASFPRSGNTFLRLLMFHLYGLETYAVNNASFLQELGADAVVGHKVLPGSLEELDAATELYFVKTHDLPINENPAIYLVRDGRDSLISYAHYLLVRRKRNQKPTATIDSQEYRQQFLKLLTELICEDGHYGGWGNNVLRWTQQRQSGSTFIIKYEDLIQEPEYWTREALQSLKLDNLSLIGHSIPDFEELHTKWPEFFRKGVVGAWRDEMPDDLQEMFWKRHAVAMQSLDYAK